MLSLFIYQIEKILHSIEEREEKKEKIAERDRSFEIKRVSLSYTFFAISLTKQRNSLFVLIVQTS